MITWDPPTPDLDALRPGRVSRPIFPELVDDLVAAKVGELPMWPVSSPIPYVMGTLSAYAYSTTGTIASIGTRLGLGDLHCRLAAEIVDTMFIRSTAYILQSADGRVVVVAYRGTSLTSAVNWLGDLDIDPEKVQLRLPGVEGDDEYLVHRGFYRNVRATAYQVIQAIKRAMSGLAVDDPDSDGHFDEVENKMEALYITGHSLGAAMAILAATLIKCQPEYNDIFEKLRGVYTYGSPMVCDPVLAQRLDQPDLLGGRVLRYIYGSDAVTQVPPKASGAFAHVGTELRYFSKTGLWEESAEPMGQLRNLLQLGELIPSFLARQITVFRHLPFSFSLSDHLPVHYLDALAPPGVRTEFGD